MIIEQLGRRILLESAGDFQWAGWALPTIWISKCPFMTYGSDDFDGTLRRARRITWVHCGGRCPLQLLKGPQRLIHPAIHIIQSLPDAAGPHAIALEAMARTNTLTDS
jgi:hypothetical protein